MNYGNVNDVAKLIGRSRSIVSRIRQRDPNAPKPVPLPTGGKIEDLDAWGRYIKELMR